jgi:hypothetical protein
MSTTVRDIPSLFAYGGPTRPDEGITLSATGRPFPRPEDIQPKLTSLEVEAVLLAEYPGFVQLRAERGSLHRFSKYCHVVAEKLLCDFASFNKNSFYDAKEYMVVLMVSDSQNQVDYP